MLFLANDLIKYNLGSFWNLILINSCYCNYSVDIFGDLKNDPKIENKYGLLKPIFDTQEYINKVNKQNSISKK